MRCGYEQVLMKKICETNSSTDIYETQWSAKSNQFKSICKKETSLINLTQSRFDTLYQIEIDPLFAVHPAGVRTHIRVGLSRTFLFASLQQQLQHQWKQQQHNYNWSMQWHWGMDRGRATVTSGSLTTLSVATVWIWPWPYVCASHCACSLARVRSWSGPFGHLATGDCLWPLHAEAGEYPLPKWP